ncbi:MAG TPA: glutamine amidotransferase [Blastocatellia bacterium]|nr:glutamine amidotransferase [Blastocatellia bacterium]HMY74000.1 glutamine amidotransferase [Blastocatellia bacterium]HMZ17861.1 glutamine amidotransferase [Blastocatellia bacterium]HNG32385.1 glutamine amidotransferase [Blastocatellia bacterium]
MDNFVQFFFKHKWTTFAKGDFSFAGRPSWLILIFLALAMGGLIYFLYIRPGYRLNSRSKWGLIGLRAGLLALIFLMLMRPVVVVPSIIPKSTSVAVMADNSRSMTLADENSRSRLDATKDLLSSGNAFTKNLNDKFRVGLYGFSNTAAKIKDANELKADGISTDVVTALREAVKESTGSPLSAIVLVSDGGANTPKDLSSELRELRARNIPVFTIGVGNPSRFKDAETVRVTTPRRVLVGSAIIAETLVRLSGYDKAKISLAVSEDGKALKTQQFDVRGGEAQSVTIEFSPSSAGNHRYTFEVKPLDGETTLENNAIDTLIEVTDDKPKILYVDGEPRWEYGFMRKAATAKTEKNLTLVSVLRSADGKFYRQGVESGSELTDGFPATVEELFTYQGIILGSVEANFFSYDRLKNIEQFAARRGGGVMAIAGSKAFDAGKYAQTPIADLLPVVLNDQVEETETMVVQNFKAALTTRGRTHPVTRLNEDRNQSAKIWDELPAISIPEILTGTKPGATIILEARGVNDKTRNLPLLVEQRYGRGRSLAFATNDSWRWRMEVSSQNNYHETFWRQLLRYLVSTTPRQFEVASERDVYVPGDTISVRSEINDKKFEAIRDAQVTARVTKPSGATVELPLKINFNNSANGQTEASSDYRSELAADETGLYKVEMTAKRGNETLGAATSAFLVTERSREFHDAAQNVELLKRVATETGGKYFELAKANNLLDEITMLEGKNSERVSKDLWDMPINFMLLIGLASAEWFLRKRKGLA